MQIEVIGRRIGRCPMSNSEMALAVLEEVIRDNRRHLEMHAYFTLTSSDRSLSQPHMAEDVLGDSIAVAIHIIRSDSNEYPTDKNGMILWLRRIITLKSLEYRRRRTRELRLNKMSEDHKDLLDSMYILHSFHNKNYENLLQEALKNLSHEERTIIERSFNEGLTSDIIGQEIDKSPSNVRKIKQRALLKVRRFMDKGSMK